MMQIGILVAFFSFVIAGATLKQVAFVAAVELLPSSLAPSCYQLQLPVVPKTLLTIRDIFYYSTPTYSLATIGRQFGLRYPNAETD